MLVCAQCASHTPFSHFDTTTGLCNQCLEETPEAEPTYVTCLGCGKEIDSSSKFCETCWEEVLLDT